MGVFWPLREAKHGSAPQNAVGAGPVMWSILLCSRRMDHGKESFRFIDSLFFEHHCANEDLHTSWVPNKSSLFLKGSRAICGTGPKAEGLRVVDFKVAFPNSMGF